MAAAHGATVSASMAVTAVGNAARCVSRSAAAERRSRRQDRQHPAGVAAVNRDGEQTVQRDRVGGGVSIGVGKSAAHRASVSSGVDGARVDLGAKTTRGTTGDAEHAL